MIGRNHPIGRFALDSHAILPDVSLPLEPGRSRRQLRAVLAGVFLGGAPLTSSTTRGPSTVLLVEDNPADAFLARRILAETDDPSPTVETEDRLAGAIQRLAVGGVDVVVLDLGLPDSNGLESFERLRREAPDVPLVILSGLDDQAIAVEAVRRGAQDFLVKGRFNGAVLSRSLRYAIERQQLQSQIFALSVTDELTGLSNHVGFAGRVLDDLRRAKRQQSEVVLGMARLEGLERINRRFGRLEGDRLVRDTATILRSTFRETDVLARAGGDRFTILLRDAGPHSIDQARRRLADHLDDYNSGLEKPFHISIRLGFTSQVPTREETLEHLLGCADALLRFAGEEESRNARAS
jgi:two-component system cell cycle response regulator